MIYQYIVEKNIIFSGSTVVYGRGEGVVLQQVLIQKLENWENSWRDGGRENST